MGDIVETLLNGLVDYKGMLEKLSHRSASALLVFNYTTGLMPLGDKKCTYLALKRFAMILGSSVDTLSWTTYLLDLDDK